MGKRDTKVSGDTQPLFPKLKSYSIDEIMAAGGTTAFANKVGKNFKNIDDRLKKLPGDAFLTDEEVAEAIKTLNQSK